MNRNEILYNIFDEVENLKRHEYVEKVNIDINFDDVIDNSSFEKQNEKVFNINLYILMRLYKDKIDALRDENGEFGINEYYELLENLNLPDTIYDLYYNMPKIVEQNKILSYATDIPSFMGMIRN